SYTGFRTHRGETHLDAREAERALLGLAGPVVEVDLLVRAARDAHPPAATPVLVDQHDAVLGPLVDRPAGARRRARRIQAVLADAWQVEHERLLELEADLVRDRLEDRVVLAGRLGATEVVVPVRRPRDLHVLTGQQRLRPGHRRVLLRRRIGERR